MKPIKIVLVVFFIAFTAIEVYAAFTNQPSLKFISTPVLMPLLCIFYVLSTSKRNWYIISALVLSFVGDILNQWQSNPDIFMIETAAFLIALICYIIALVRPVSHFRKVPMGYYTLLIIYIGYGVFIYGILDQYLSDMRVPAIIYLATVLLMGYSAATRRGAYIGLPFWLPLIGTILFIASDTFLAVNAFKYDGKMQYGDFMTTISYIPAQVLIVLGLTPKEEIRI